ncbi:uncharacterized protein LOC116930100 [Daphnia magna]|uniref:uncharacterized protein LOC116930100 n=1 Tax=Daphnia magna TaxID=35525 RepID=UPI001E1BACAE|nr:uncharacterized protein LOC116930100 [Daphnia magna]
MDCAFEISCPVIDCNAQRRMKQQMLSHYRVVHRGDADFKAPCFECEKEFRTEIALRKHLSRHHVLFFNNEAAAVIPALEVPRPQSVNSDLHQPILSSKICILQTISMTLPFTF